MVLVVRGRLWQLAETVLPPLLEPVHAIPDLHDPFNGFPAGGSHQWIRGACITVGAATLCTQSSRFSEQNRHGAYLLGEGRRARAAWRFAAPLQAATLPFLFAE